MQLHDLRPAKGSTQKRKRIGRGTGSGKGKTSGRGTKGQLSRNGGNVHPAFEGGQISLVKRMPKLRGFNNRFKVEYTPVNLDALDSTFEANTEVTPELLAALGLTGKVTEPIVVLARGEITKALKLKVHRISATAKQKIEAAGGSIETLPVVVNKKMPRS